MDKKTRMVLNLMNLKLGLNILKMPNGNGGYSQGELSAIADDLLLSVDYLAEANGIAEQEEVEELIALSRAS